MLTSTNEWMLMCSLWLADRVSTGGATLLWRTRALTRRQSAGEVDTHSSAFVFFIFSFFFLNLQVASWCCVTWREKKHTKKNTQNKTRGKKKSNPSKPTVSQAGKSQNIFVSFCSFFFFVWKYCVCESTETQMSPH